VTSFGASIFSAGTPGLVFLLLLLAAAAAVSGCFLVAVLSPDAATAASTAAVAWLVTYLPYALVASASSGGIDADIPGGVAALICFLPPSAQGLGMAALAQWEASGEGATYATLWTTPPANEAGDVGVPLGAAMLLLFIDAVGLMFLALWIDSSRFRSKDARALAAAAKDATDAAAAAAAAAAAGGGGRTMRQAPALVAAGLRREYSGARTTVALEGLDLVCAAGEITVLLGHNGAGKSSAIGCLVGAAPPTAGRALIGGLDAVVPAARRALGFCPQHDTLWDGLTVQDHLDLWLRLRGVWNGKERERQRVALLREVELMAKRRVRAGALSGGMRRRLSVALAFAGNPTHVILDEPTAGVDPRARRQIQDLVLSKARGRAVLVTTHHLDEAERLGTRVRPYTRLLTFSTFARYFKFAQEQNGSAGATITQLTGTYLVV
jgi:ABC-type taurine transport system ATPase subunit